VYEFLRAAAVCTSLRNVVVASIVLECFFLVSCFFVLVFRDLVAMFVLGVRLSWIEGVNVGVHSLKSGDM